jgi:predicted DNA-binding transcriptional regulator YafY
LVRQLFQLAAEKFPPIDTVQGLRKISSVYPLPDPAPLTTAVPDHLRDLQEAVSAQKRVRIIYTNSIGEQTDRIIAPRWIHELKSTLYVTAWCELTAEERTFRLDRIVQIMLVQEIRTEGSE